MISFNDDNNETLFEYSPSYMDNRMLAKLGLGLDDEGRLERYTLSSMPHEVKQLRSLFQGDLSITIKRVFTFVQEDLVSVDHDEQVLVFRFASFASGNYEGYRVIGGRVFGINQNVLIDRAVKLDWRLFCVGYNRHTSVFRKIAKVVDSSAERIIIGGDAEGAIPMDAFIGLLGKFPTTAELERYGDAVIESYVHDYIALAKDFSAEYEKRYVAKRKSAFDSLDLRSPMLDQSRIETLVSTRAMLESLLDQGESVPEEIWQKRVLEILPTLLPQYVCVIPKARVRDVIHGKDREIDFLLVDAAGNVDVLEIKKAFAKSHLIMMGKYRGNYIPARELTGGIAQIEKYIHYLLNWGPEGEERLTERYRARLPEGMKLRFVNPRGLLLLGHCDLDEEEQRDFEIIRRQYSHIADVFTYDDLLCRLSRMIEAITGDF